jgi:quinol monooxygenase YgiN
MFARMVFFKLEPGNREAAEKVVQELNVISRTQKGFRGNSYFFEDHEGESANAIMFPHFCEAVKGIVKEEPRLRIFEVYDPLEKVPLDTSVSLYDY